MKVNHIREGRVGQWQQYIKGDDLDAFRKKGEGREWLNRFDM